MRENIYNALKICIAFMAGFILAALITGATDIFFAGRSAGTISDLNRQCDQLNRELAERQRIIGIQHRQITEGVERCIGYAENAGRIIERSNESAKGAISDLRAASALIRQGIEERENLKMELDNLRSGLYGLRDMAGQPIE